MQNIIYKYFSSDFVNNKNIMDLTFYEKKIFNFVKINNFNKKKSCIITGTKRSFNSFFFLNRNYVKYMSNNLYFDHMFNVK
uniref:Ribosomal protein S14 n=1 Tax=Acavomonas peruviana TaxID=1542312 RepID=V5KVG3_9ALVE|nr:ribosomal protein S14 [Acavomonas peruviana]